MKRLPLAAAAVAIALLLAGCSSSNDKLAQEYQKGSNLGYQVGDGSIVTYAADKRDAPVTFTSTTDAGVTVTSKQYLGKVLVLNFWYASCAPCRVEAPVLEKAKASLPTASVSFLGVNLRDQADTAKTFERSAGLTYPSVIDTNDGNVLLAFAGKVSANAVPTTMVLDKQGRVAARLLGQIKSPTTLNDIVDDVLAEDG